MIDIPTVLPFSIILIVIGATLVRHSTREMETGRKVFGVILTVVGLAQICHCLIAYGSRG